MENVLKGNVPFIFYESKTWFVSALCVSKGVS